MPKTKMALINDLVNMELECDYPADLHDERVGTTKEEIREHFNSYSIEELKVLWIDTFYAQVEEEANARNVTLETVLEDWKGR
jgi:hypothetical protein|tara:strand:+ start:3216 stop:3464 length:249 start_codon:yes stop_codon:yes gene_type:complete